LHRSVWCFVQSAHDHRDSCRAFSSLPHM
jgi:hypothetical protein